MEDSSNTSADQHLVAHIADAAAWYRHAEVIVQQRLYNFLMAASILILAAATSLSASPHSGQRAVVLTVSVVGLLLSIGYSILGVRQIRFVDLHMDICKFLESRLSDPRNQVITETAKLRSGEVTKSPLTGSVRPLSFIEKVTRSSNFLVVAPLGFAVVFAVFIWLGIEAPPFEPLVVAKCG